MRGHEHPGVQRGQVVQDLRDQRLEQRAALVLLRRPENGPEYDEAELERIQREHLAHHARLRDSGHVVTNGPVVEPPDPSLRGLSVLPDRLA